MPHLIYDGLLSRDVLGYVERSKYPIAIEMAYFPPHDRFQKLFADKSWDHHGEDCMGGETHSVREGIPYEWIAKNFTSPHDKSGFLMVPSTEDRDRIVAAFPNLVVNSNPFKTPIKRPDVPVERKTDREWADGPVGRTFLLVAGWTFVSAAFVVALLALSGCTSGPAYPRSIADGGTMVGPYDITLTSHQEALGIR